MLYESPVTFKRGHAVLSCDRRDAPAPTRTICPGAETPLATLRHYAVS